MLNKFVAEFLGTLFLVYIVLATQSAIAIGAGLAIAIMVLGGVSGGLFNPALSVVMAAAGKITTNDMLMLILAQVFGGLVALELFKRVKM